MVEGLRAELRFLGFEKAGSWTEAMTLNVTLVQLAGGNPTTALIVDIPHRKMGEGEILTDGRWEPHLIYIYI